MLADIMANVTGKQLLSCLKRFISRAFSHGTTGCSGRI